MVAWPHLRSRSASTVCVRVRACALVAGRRVLKGVWVGPSDWSTRPVVGLTSLPMGGREGGLAAPPQQISHHRPLPVQAGYVERRVAVLPLLIHAHLRSRKRGAWAMPSFPFVFRILRYPLARGCTHRATTPFRHTRGVSHWRRQQLETDASESSPPHLRVGPACRPSPFWPAVPPPAVFTFRSSKAAWRRAEGYARPQRLGRTGPAQNCPHQACRAIRAYA